MQVKGSDVVTARKRRKVDEEVNAEQKEERLRQLSSSSFHCIQSNSLSYLISDRSFVLTLLFVHGIFSGKKKKKNEVHFMEKGHPCLYLEYNLKFFSDSVSDALQHHYLSSFFFLPFFFQ